MATERRGGRAQHQESSSSTSCWENKVFLSFRGKDTRKNFIDHLYAALLNAGFQPFRDDDEMERGEYIASELSKAIRQSKISVIVFSKDYASSKWCLDELVNILLERKERNAGGHMVLPVFYHVDPSDVRNQTGTFAEAFARHEKRFEAELDRVVRWRAALREAANLAGMALQNQFNGHEAQFIQNIVKEIGKKLNCSVLSVGLHLIGTDFHVKYINSWLEDGSTDIGVGVICGMGGIGKTTIAKIAYNKNFNKFEGSSFLANIREAFKQYNGLLRLQRQLLSDILKVEKIKIYNSDKGIIEIKRAVYGKRVLMFLDDIDHLDQLDAILGRRHDWFSPGSKIIITTRHERLLKAREACKIFKVTELDKHESLQLFSWHAFGQHHPIEGYMTHSRSIVRQCGGLPLALKVLGSSLSGISVDVWESATQKLKAIPNSDILESLKTSYDSIKDDHDKNLFLDIACFFVGKTKDYIITILDGCNFYTTVGIQNLVDRCLITIDYNNMIGMHQLLQDMGREIVFRESPKNPGKQSRLWDHKDALSVLRNETGTEAIEGLILTFPKVIKDVPDKAISYENNAKRRKLTLFNDEGTSAKRRCLGFSRQLVNTSSQKSFSIPTMGDLSTEAFARMHRLRLLSLNYVQLSGGYENFPKDIRWLCWHGFPMESIPANFSLENLVVLEMHDSCLTHLWKGPKLLGKLKILDLSYSHGLVRTPDVSGLTCLERLILKNCISLVEVHESIGCLGRLVFLSLKGCKTLRKLPQNISNMTSLQEINLSGCSKLEPVKSESCQLWHSMWSLILRRQLPEVIHFSMASLPCSLVKLSLAKSNLNAIPNDICTLTALRILDLCGNPFRSLPESIRLLTKLECLQLQGCLALQSLPKLRDLRLLVEHNCRSLEGVPNLTSNLLRSPHLNLESCNKLVGVEGILKLEPIGNIDTKIIDKLRLFDIESLGSINVNLYNALTRTTLKMPLQVLDECGIVSIFHPGSQVPNWFSYKNIGGSRISFKVPLLPNRKIRGLIVCVVYEGKRNNTWDDPWNFIRVRNVTKGCRWDYYPVCHAIPEEMEDMIWLSHWKFKGDELKGGDQVTVSSFMGYDFLKPGFWRKKIGIHLVYEEEQEEQTQDYYLNGESIIKVNLSPTCFQNITDYPKSPKNSRWNWFNALCFQPHGIYFEDCDWAGCEWSECEEWSGFDTSGVEAYREFETSRDEDLCILIEKRREEQIMKRRELKTRVKKFFPWVENFIQRRENI